MKTVRFFALLLAVCMAVCGAAFAREEAPARTPRISVTTGLITDKEYTPYMVQIDNAVMARPQLGLSEADVIYEAEILNGSATRYTLLFNDTMPEEVMPVRSARIMHADMAADWNATLVHWGGQKAAGTSVYDHIEEYNLPHIDGISTADEYFYRSGDRVSPHNVVLKLKELAASEEYAYSAQEKAPLSFSAEDYTQKGEPIGHVQIRYAKSFIPGYRYLPEEGVYQRYYRQELQLDANGEEIRVANVIIMYADYEYYNWEDDRPVVQLTGKNACKYFIDGMYFEGYWTRESMDDATVFFDADGEQVLFKPGKTAIQVLREGKEIIMQ